ncbi:MAG: UbiA family prenyltransferase, partial [Candidatus Omnitrophica bacterium]|nr:UbiA family prenyltransferase [Candidatus Omnitrophota bacterium]
TDYTHVYLGVALALAPLGAWLAVRGSLSLAPLVLAVAVVFWLIGFDIIYSIQDHEFDRRSGLHSLAVAWGVQNALKAAFIAHLAMWLLLMLFGLLSRFRVAYLVGQVVILVSLLLEHWLARIRSMKWTNIAFYRLNILISIVFLVVVVSEVVTPSFRITR